MTIKRNPWSGYVVLDIPGVGVVHARVALETLFWSGDETLSSVPGYRDSMPVSVAKRLHPLSIPGRILRALDDGT